MREVTMKTFEHNPFTDVYVPYLVKPESKRVKLLWKIHFYAPVPYLSRWIIAKSFRRRARNHHLR